MSTAPAFPFAIGPAGQVRVAADDDEALRGRILQVLFTSPGERVGVPEFGCGLLDVVFEPGDELIAASVRFTVMEALGRWLGDEIAVDGVDVTRDDTTVTVEVAYTRLADRHRAGLRARLPGGPPWRTG